MPIRIPIERKSLVDEVVSHTDVSRLSDRYRSGDTLPSLGLARNAPTSFSWGSPNDGYSEFVDPPVMGRKIYGLDGAEVVYYLNRLSDRLRREGRLKTDQSLALPTIREVMQSQDRPERQHVKGPWVYKPVPTSQSLFLIREPYVRITGDDMFLEHVSLEGDELVGRGVMEVSERVILEHAIGLLERAGMVTETDLRAYKAFKVGDSYEVEDRLLQYSLNGTFRITNNVPRNPILTHGGEPMPLAPIGFPVAGFYEMRNFARVNIPGSKAGNKGTEKDITGPFSGVRTFLRNLKAFEDEMEETRQIRSWKVFVLSIQDYLTGRLMDNAPIVPRVVDAVS